jgi:hypothetical protein
LPLPFVTSPAISSCEHGSPHADRTHPIYHSYPYEKEDDIRIELPSGWQVSSLPTAQDRNTSVVTYSLKAEGDKTVLHLSRKLTVKFMMLETKYYPALREFYQFVRSGDDQQIVLEGAATASN